ncbi:MAG TPA: Gfo/Idh/MocA family oxidoreductase [Clostridiales bacterium]|nr:Gfo/Idh/MocA family oxidoreductase [Clostridiales bacterium]
MKKVLKVGIIGTGWISNQHINGYLQCDHVEIAAVADINENAAREVMRKYNLDCKYYSDYKKLLANSEIDAISICVPNAFHSEVTIAAAMAGKHIMAEKPFVSSIEEAKKSLKAIKENGVKCAVGYHRRFNPLYREMKRLINKGDLGRVFFAQSDYIHNFSDLPIISWALKKEFNPSVFHAGGGHCVDMIRYLVNDEIAEVCAFVDNSTCPECETEAQTIAIFRFQNGQLGKVTSICPNVITPFTFNVEVYGTKGTFKNNKLILDSFPDFRSKKQSEAYAVYPEWMPDNTPGITEPWDIEIKEFVNWVLNDDEKTDLCTAQDAVRAAEACWAAVISNAEKRIVKLPLIDFV